MLKANCGIARIFALPPKNNTSVAKYSWSVFIKLKKLELGTLKQNVSSAEGFPLWSEIRLGEELQSRFTGRSTGKWETASGRKKSTEQSEPGPPNTFQ